MRWWWAIPFAIGVVIELYRQWQKSRRAPVIAVEGDDPAMSEAITQAKATLPEFIAVLGDPRPGHRDFAVKAFFPDLGEHIWIGEVTHGNGAFSGLLGNHPMGRTTLRLGDRVTVPEARITDWKYVQHDVLIGGYSVRLLRSRMDDDARRAFDSQVDFRIL
jgi:uncharacterized protein YegJ (DUF2314 family)